MLHSTKPGSVLLPRVCLSVTLRPSLPSSGIPAASCLNLSLVSQSWSRSTGLSGSLSFSNPPGPSLDFGFSVQTWPPPPPKSRSSPRPAGRPGSVRSGGRPPGLSAPAPPLPAPPPPVITAGPEWGAGGGGPGAGIRSQVRRGAHLEAGGGSGEGGPRVPRRLVPAGRAELGPSELPATVPAAHGLCGRVGARPQPLPEEVRAGPAPPGPRPRPPLPAGCGPSPGPASQRPGARPRPPLLFGLEPAAGPLGRLCLTWLSQPSRAARTPPPSPPSFRRPLPLPPPLPTAASGRLLHSISSKGYRTQPTKVHWGTKSPHGLFVSLPLPPHLPAYPPGVTL